MKTIDKEAKIPLYYQLMNILISDIEAGIYGEQEKLPSERELCQKYDVSRITVRQTLQELEQEGYIYKKHGLGTFVAPKAHDQKLLKFYSFTEEMKKLNKNPSTNVIDFEIITSDSNLSNKLNLQPLEEVYKIVRLRLADEEALIFETSFLPVRYFPNLTKQELTEKPMYDVLRDKYSTKITKGIEKFTSVKAREEEAKWLNVEIDDACMLLKRYTYDINENIIEYTRSIARGDKFYYTVELNL